MEIGNFKTEGAIAKAIGETVANFSNKKKTGTIKNALLVLGVEKGGRLDWLRTGKGEKYLAAEAEKWKEKFHACSEDLNEAHKKIDRLTAPPSGVSSDAG